MQASANQERCTLLRVGTPALLGERVLMAASLGGASFHDFPHLLQYTPFGS